MGSKVEPEQTNQQYRTLRILETISLALIGQTPTNQGLSIQNQANRLRKAEFVKFCLNFNNSALQRIHVFLPHLYRIALKCQDNKKNKQLAAFVNAKTHSKPNEMQQISNIPSSNWLNSVFFDSGWTQAGTGLDSERKLWKMVLWLTNALGIPDLFPDAADSKAATAPWLCANGDLKAP